MSELPFAQLSEDSNFHEYNGGSDFRYSLLYFPLGTYKLYIFTWTSKKQFHFFKAISLKEICQAKIDEKEKNIENIDIINENDDVVSEEQIEEKESEIENLSDFALEDLDFANMDLEDKKEDKSIKGEDMSDEFLELDSLNEQDLIEALGGASTQSSVQNVVEEKTEQKEMQSSNNLDISSSNVNDIASLISNLLNNKTLEITIKIKE